MQCSFCHKYQNQVPKLLSSPSDYPRAYICAECVAICAAIIEDDRAGAADPAPVELHPLLDHPSASLLLHAIERWIRQEALGADTAEELAEVRRLATIMMTQP